MGVQVSSSSSSDRKTGRISVVPHIENGGCMEMEGISDLGWAVGTDVGIELGWQRRGRRCSCSCRLGNVRHILGCRIDARMDVVIAAFDGFRGLDLAPALPLAPFLPPGCSPSTAPMPYVPSYGCNALGPSRRRRRPVRLRPRPPSPMLNARSHAVLAEGTRIQILRLVRSQFCIRV